MAITLSSTSKLSVQLVSDLHFSNLTTINYGHYIRPTGDILAILGDVTEFTSNSLHIWEDLLQYCSDNFFQTIIVLGNHDYFTDDSSNSMNKIEDELKCMCSLFKNVHILQNDCIVVNNTLIVGSTLWSNVPDFCKNKVQNGMNDYRLIYLDNGKLNDVNNTNTLHSKSVKYIESKLKERDLYDNIIVLTHHAPSFQNTSAPRHGNTLKRKLNAAFSTNLEHLFYNDVIWCYGHTHYNHQQQIHNTKLYTNQRGSQTDWHYRSDYVLSYLC